MYLLLKKLNMEEIWKDIKGYEGYYQISSFGRIRGKDRLVFHHFYSNEIKSNLKIYKGKIMSSSLVRGYNGITLHKNNISSTKRVCRLVAMVFIPNPENKPCVNHIDGNKLNDSFENLEWVTYVENMKHAFENDLVNNPKGADCKQSKKVINIKTNKVFDTIKDAAKEMGISSSGLSRRFTGEIKNNSPYRLLDNATL